jgi:hypothetical protein
MGGDDVSGSWRVGPPLSTVYDGDRPVCQCYNPEDAARIVEALNRVSEFKRIHDECHQQRDEARAALKALVDLKDGLRDERYRVTKDVAWDQARSVVSGSPRHDPER